MKLTYWYSRCLRDSDNYSIRERTKKEAELALSRHIRSDYGPIVKVTVEYSSGFDLLKQIQSEGGNHREFLASHAAENGGAQ